MKFNVSTIGKGGLLTLSQVVANIFTSHAKREVFDISLVVGNAVTLQATPQNFSEQVVVEGLVMTEGASYDYVLANNIITFNINVLPSDGHILVNYIS